MGFLSQRKPRGFHHEYIYFDERKEKLRKIEERAKRELGMLPDEPMDKEKIHEAFLQATTHQRRRSERGGESMSLKWLLVLIAGCLFVLHYLMTNSWSLF